MSTILALGDSLTAHSPTGTPGNFSYTQLMHQPIGYTLVEEGVPTATLHHIRDLKGTLVDTLVADDIFLLMGRAVTQEWLDPSVEAAIDMLGRARAAGAYTMFMTQPKFYYAYAGPNNQGQIDMACWEQIRQWCATNNVIYMNNYIYWAAEDYDQWWWLYQEDEVHLTQCGAHFLAHSVDYIAKAVWGL